MKKTLSIILLCVFISGIIYSLYNIIIWKKDTSFNNEIKSEINKNINIISSDDENESEFEVDFNKLKSINNDTVAYLKVNNTNIDYVVVKGNDNSYYLKHNFNKKYNSAGWIFADYKNNLDGNDKNLVIYGHNMKDGSMFGSLKNILKKDWYTNDENRVITLVTESGIYYYEVFSIYSTKKEDYYITTNFNSESDYEKFLIRIKDRSKYNYDIELNKDDKILTLSSCTNSIDGRIVLHARRVN